MLDDILLDLGEFSDDAFLNQPTASLEACRTLASACTAGQQTVTKCHYSERQWDMTFLPDDLILIFFPICQIGHCKKFLSRYRGPYQVIQRTSPRQLSC